MGYETRMEAGVADSRVIAGVLLLAKISGQAMSRTFAVSLRAELESTP